MKLTRQPYILGGVGKGWEKIVEECDQALAKIDPHYGLAQIKEKFGGLRFYFDTKTDKYDEMDAVVREAELKASVTCEFCGNPGESRGGGWIKTLCDDCDRPRR